MNPSIYQQQAFIKGMTYPGFSREIFLDPRSEKSIKKLRKTGTEWVSITFSWYQENFKSVKIKKHPVHTPSDKSLVHMIKHLHQKGFKVMLKPMVESEDGTSPGDLKPKDWHDWFQSYRNFMLHYIKIAEVHKVGMVCVGSDNVLGSRRRQIYWRNLIHEARYLYGGKLTFAASWSKKNSFKQAFFWPLLDYIGINAWFPVSEFAGSSAEEMGIIWKKHIKRIESWHKKSFPDTPILFTEIGACSHTGSAVAPWFFDEKAEPDYQEQANYYQAFFEAFKEKKWLHGVFWWSWDNPSTLDYKKNGDAYHTSFTPHGKPSGEILKAYFG